MSKKLLYTLLLLVTFFLYYALISPLYSGEGGVFNLGEGVKTLKSKKVEYASAQVEATNLLSDAESKLAAYKKISIDDKQKMSVMLPESIDTIRLLHELSLLSITAGMPLSSLTVSEPGMSSGGKGTVTISMSMKTTYVRFKEFLSVLEHSMRLFAVRSVTFSAPEAEGDPVTFNVTLETYYLP